MLIIGEQRTAATNPKHIQSENGIAVAPTNTAHFTFKKSVLDLTSRSEDTFRKNLDLLSNTCQADHLIQWADISDRYVTSGGSDSFDNVFWRPRDNSVTHS